MPQKLPKEIDPLRLAKNGLKLTGQLAIADMPRLQQSLLSDEGTIKVNIAFDMDEIDTPYMQGEFATTVLMTCERCMTAMTLDLNVNSLLAIVINEQKIASLDKQYDPWLLASNDEVSLSSVVEDELILALPIVPRHNEVCLPASEWFSADELVGEAAEKVSPFAILSTLKTKN